MRSAFSFDRILARVVPAEISEEFGHQFIVENNPCGRQHRLHNLGAEPAGGQPEYMQRCVLAETEKWSKLAKFTGIKPE